MSKERTAIAITQKFHLHPFAALKYEPATGPITGPRSGPILNSAMLAPLFSCGNRSEIEAPPSVIGQTPKAPMKNRKAINCAKEPATAHAIVKMRNMTLQTA